jgi:hypothetical protein
MISSSTDEKEIRKFGVIALCLFGVLLAASLWREKWVLSIFFGMLACLGFLFLIFPRPLKSVYEGWLSVSRIIGKMTTGMILALTYYLAITPTAALKRIFGGRPLPVSPDRGNSTYWVSRSEPAQPKERFQKRY